MLPLRRAATFVTHHPIEVIVTSFLIATVSYFQLLYAIKHSEFLLIDTPSKTKTIHLDESKSSSSPIELRQLIISHPISSEFSFSIKDNLHELVSAVHPKPLFTHTFSPDQSSTVYSYGFTSQQDAYTWDSSVASLNLSDVASADAALQLNVLSPLKDTYQSLINGPVPLRGDVQIPAMMLPLVNSFWMFRAVFGFVVRLWNLAQKADSADIFIMILGYALMHGTFVGLFLNMRKLGSRFWLGSSVLLSGVFALLSALLTACLAGFAINPILLSEALPFLVITVGFEKPIALTRAVFSNPAIGPLLPKPEDSKSGLESPLTPGTSSLQVPRTIRWAAPPTSKELVISAIMKVGPQIIRDYAIEISVLAVGASVGVGGLREFCGLAALILTFDCVFLFFLYTAILTVMVEIFRIKIMQGVKRADSTADLTRILDNSIQETNKEKKSKPRSVGYYIRKIVQANVADPENPTLRLKILLISSLIIVHVLNLSTTLNDLTAHIWYKEDVIYNSPMSPLAPVLHNLSALGYTVANITPPLRYEILTTLPSQSELPEKFFAITSIVTGWAMSIVNDPIASKWLVVFLGLSVFLNGFLLKGLSFGGHHGATAETARLLLSSTNLFEENKDDERNSLRMRRRWSGGLEGLPKLQGGWTLADAAEMAKARRKEMEAEERARRDSDSSSEAPSPIFSATHKRKVFTLASAEKDQEPTPVPKQQQQITSAELPNIEIVDSDEILTPATTVPDESVAPRPLDEIVALFDKGKGAHEVTDEEIIILVQRGKVAAYALEKLLSNAERAVGIRRALISRASTTKTLEKSMLPYNHYDYSKVIGQCCENVVGYMPIPVGIAGPLRIDKQTVPIPMATTEGALVASASRGCKALNACGGVTTVLTKDAMTRGPALEFPTVTRCAAAKKWIDSEEGSLQMKAAFNSTTRFGRLLSLKTTMAGRILFVRFQCQTGDAMGMNMISKGSERALDMMMTDFFPDMKVITLSGNYCMDKKPAAINWIEGRGKSVVAEGVITGDVVQSVLKTSVAALVKLSVTKNLIGSSMAGSIGGNNAHASNILTAIYLATGQDPAQNVESSNCMTLMEAINDGKDLLVTCTMPSIEVGTIGGGTTLPPQASMLELLGVRGPHAKNPGENAQRLARIICAAVMAGELSLMSALASGHLVTAHLALNRSTSATPATAQTLGHTFLTPASTRPPTPAVNGMTSNGMTPANGLALSSSSSSSSC